MDFDEILSIIAKIILIICGACVATIGVCTVIAFIRFIIAGGTA